MRMAGGSPFSGSFSKEWGTARMRLNFEVIYPSAIIGTKAPSIVETTDAQQRRASHPPILNHFQVQQNG
jgi:hypothetical protein